MAFFDLFSWLLKRPYGVVSRAPILDSIGNQTVNAGDTLTITLSSTSPQSYTPTYSVDILPDGATLVDNIFTWTPDIDDAGDTTFTFTVSDDGGSDSETIVITVIAWSTNIIPLLRVIIGDYETPYLYPTSQLHSIICVAGLTVQQEITFDNTYTVDLINSRISPSPSEKAFVNLTALRSACIIGLGEARSDAENAVVVGDGAASLDQVKIADSKIKWSDDICKKYQKALKSYKMGKYNVGNSIVGPFGDSLYHYRNRMR